MCFCFITSHKQGEKAESTKNERPDQVDSLNWCSASSVGVRLGGGSFFVSLEDSSFVSFGLFFSHFSEQDFFYFCVSSKGGRSLLSFF